MQTCLSYCGPWRITLNGGELPLHMDAVKVVLDDAAPTPGMLNSHLTREPCPMPRIICTASV